MSALGRPLRLCAISFKLCWRADNGAWMSSGGFPLQMAAVGSLFNEMDLLIVETAPQDGGVPLPPYARVIPLRAPRGVDGRRKLFVATHLLSYIRAMAVHIRHADVVHVPLPGDLPLLGLLTALVQRKRIIARYGGSWPANSQSTLVSRLTKSIMRRVAGGRNVMLATGEAPDPPAPRMSWIFSTALSQAEISRLPDNLDRGLSTVPQLVYVGRLSSEKGVSIVLEALVLLASHTPPLRPQLTLIGDGPERGALEDYARSAGIGDRVRFAGQLGRAALGDALCCADVCVQPSLTEGFSKAWLDALAHGLPVVASQVGAAEAVIGGHGERGWLVPPGEAAALAATLADVLLTPRDWPGFRLRCRAYVEGRTLEAWAERIGEIRGQQWGLRFADGRLSV